MTSKLVCEIIKEDLIEFMITERFSFSSKEKAVAATATVIFSAPVGIRIYRAFSERRRVAQAHKEELKKESTRVREVAEDSYNAGDSGFDFSKR